MAPETTDDTFLGGRLSILQPLSGHRAGLDAVFLSAAVPIEPSRAESVLDAGTGTGLVALAIARRAPSARVTGIERDPDLARMARENAARNGLEDRVRIVTGDLTRPLAELETPALPAAGFDHVVANPPFDEIGRVRLSPEPARQAAGAMEPGGLARWARFLAAMAAPGGRLTMIHRACALPALIETLTPRFGGLEIYPLFPHASAPAHRVILRGIKASRAPLALLSGMVLHETDGGWRPEANAILRGAEPLDFL